MKKFEYEFEKSIIDWKGVLASLIQFWWLPVIILILSGILAVLLPKVLSKSSQADYYEIDYCLYIERDYNSANLPPMNNILALLSNDMIWEEVNSELQAEGNPALQDGEREVQGKTAKGADFYHIIMEGEEPDRMDQIFDKLLIILEKEIGDLDGFKECRFVSRSETRITTAIDGKRTMLYCLVFGLVISCGVLILVSMLDKRIWSDYDLKLYFEKYYLGKIERKEIEKKAINERIFRRIKGSDGIDIYVNAATEWIQDSEGRLLMQSCGRKFHSLNELWNRETEMKTEHAVLLLIVRKGITTSEEINNVMEDAQMLGLNLAGCVMLA